MIGFLQSTEEPTWTVSYSLNHDNLWTEKKRNVRNDSVYLKRIHEFTWYLERKESKDGTTELENHLASWQNDSWRQESLLEATPW